MGVLFFKWLDMNIHAINEACELQSLILKNLRIATENSNSFLFIDHCLFFSSDSFHVICSWDQYYNEPGPAHL